MTLPRSTGRNTLAALPDLPPPRIDRQCSRAGSVRFGGRGRLGSRCATRGPFCVSQLRRLHRAVLPGRSRCSLIARLPIETTLGFDIRAPAAGAGCAGSAAGAYSKSRAARPRAPKSSTA